MVKYDHMMQVWFETPNKVDWHYTMLGSQGVRENIPFIDEAGVYVETFFKYVTNGRGEGGKAWVNSWGCSPKLALHYLDWRDGLNDFDYSQY